MEALRLSFAASPGWPRPAVILGNLDGVHRGHQALAAVAVRDASGSGGTAAAVTFDPHPSRVLSPDRAPLALMTLDQKAEALAALGIERLAVVPFTRELSEWAAAEFVQRILVDALGAAVVVVGSNFRFGRGREGDPALLAILGERLGFAVHAVEPVFHDGAPISSTRIREALARGAVEGACQLLGRPYRILGRVVRGEGRGRGLGFPTANLDPLNEVLPARGVYAARAALRAAGPEHAAVVNIGHRPTFGHGALQVEAHLLAFEGELYGGELRLDFLARLRGEERFSSPGALADQISRDVQAAAGVVEALAGSRYSRSEGASSAGSGGALGPQG